MRKRQKANGRDDFLARIARFHRSDAWRSVCLLASISLSGVGVLLLLYVLCRAIQGGKVFVPGDLALAVLGLLGIFAAWLIRVGLCMSRVAHEILLHLDEEYNETERTELARHQEVSSPKCGTGGLTYQLPLKYRLRELSTRDLRTSWRLLVVVPIVAGLVSLLLTIGAWRIRSLDVILQEWGVRLEYLCIAGLLSIAVGGYLMLLGGIVSKRVDGPKRPNR